MPGLGRQFVVNVLNGEFGSKGELDAGMRYLQQWLGMIVRALGKEEEFSLAHLVAALAASKQASKQASTQARKHASTHARTHSSSSRSSSSSSSVS